MLSILTAFLVVQNYVYALPPGNVEVILNSTSPPKEGKIIGGSYVTIIDYPYQLYLLTNTGACGGSIISSYWALSAAHCLYGIQSGYFRAGSTDKSAGGSIHNIYSYVVHPYYRSYALDYDYAVAKVKTPFPINTPGYAAITLTKSDPSAGLKTYVSGWGTTSYQGSVSTLLKAAKLYIVDRTTCAKTYGSTLTTRMICADSNDGEGSCNGDSGGPLVDRTTKIQYGIVSFGIQCRNTGIPTVYSNIANQRLWIKSVTNV